MIVLSAPRLNNLIAMIIGIICSQSVVLSKISQELKDCYSYVTEESKIKRLQRFLTNKTIEPERLYESLHISYYKNINLSQNQYIIFDNTIIDYRFVILQFSLKSRKKGYSPLV